MKTQLSPLNCIYYYVADVATGANPRFDVAMPTTLSLEDLNINVEAEPFCVEEKQHCWRVALRIVQKMGPEKNSPYNFSISLIGLFEVHPQFPKPEMEKLVRVNGSSILYGVAREQLRQIMCGGPFAPLLLPTVSFSV